MTDENDVITDQSFYATQSVVDGKWRLFDSGVESACFGTRPEIEAFVFGLWRGMAIMGEVDLTCAIFNHKGILLDTMVSKQMLAG